MQLSTNSRQSLWSSGTRRAAEMAYLAAGHVQPTTKPRERMNMREQSFTLKPTHQILMPFSLLPTTLYRWHHIYNCSPDLADGPLWVHGCPTGMGLLTSQTSMDAKLTSKHFLTEQPWAYESGEVRWGTWTIPKSQELNTIKVRFMFLLTCAFYAGWGFVLDPLFPSIQNSSQWSSQTEYGQSVAEEIKGSRRSLTSNCILSLSSNWHHPFQQLHPTSVS